MSNLTVLKMREAQEDVAAISDDTPMVEALGAYARFASLWLRCRASPRALLRCLFSPAALGVGYAVTALFTFGHVAAANYRADQYEYSECDRSRRANEDDAFNSCHQPDVFLDAMMGLGAGAAWPLYLSWELQQ